MNNSSSRTAKESLLSVAFLFDADHDRLGSVYGPPCTGRVVRAVQRLSSTPSTRIQRGDLLLHNLAYDLGKVTVGKTKSGRRQTSSTMKGNKDRYFLAICDFVQSLLEEFHTVSENDLLMAIPRRRIWMVVLPSISITQARQVDKAIRSYPTSPRLE